MSKKYRMGKRFQKVLTMGILAEIAVLVVAYFVYDWLLGEWIPSLTGGPLLAIFGSIGILAVWCTNKFLRRFNENYWYEVTEKGLRMNRGQTARFYPWEDFKGARVNRFSFLSALPVIFDMTNGPMELFQLIAAQKNQRAVGYIQTLAQENEKNIAGAKSTLDENIKLFADYSKVERVLRRPSSADEPYLAPSDLESSHIFLVVPDKKQEFYSLFCNIVVTQMLDYIGQRPYDRSRDKRILLALDEFASLRHLEILGPMRKFRKNGANICILTQSLADIDLEYSRDERKVILDNCTYTVVLSGNDPETRTYFSDLVGKEDHRKISTTTGSRTDSTSTSLQEGYAIHPNTWKSLGEQLVVIHRTGYLKLRKNFYFKG